MHSVSRNGCRLRPDCTGRDNCRSKTQWTAESGSGGSRRPRVRDRRLRRRGTPPARELQRLHASLDPTQAAALYRPISPHFVRELRTTGGFRAAQCRWTPHRSVAGLRVRQRTRRRTLAPARWAQAATHLRIRNPRTRPASREDPRDRRVFAYRSYRKRNTLQRAIAAPLVSRSRSHPDSLA